MKEVFTDYFVFVSIGTASAWYACSRIYKILKSPRPYHIMQYFQLCFALFMILLGISTFFTMDVLNCLCGFYAGLSEFIGLYHSYLEDRKKNIAWHNNMIYYTKSFGFGLSFILFSLHFTLKMFLD